MKGQVDFVSQTPTSVTCHSGSIWLEKSNNLEGAWVPGMWTTSGLLLRGISERNEVLLWLLTLHRQNIHPV